MMSDFEKIKYFNKFHDIYKILSCLIHRFWENRDLIIAKNKPKNECSDG